jgi:uncharacterized membrane protein
VNLLRGTPGHPLHPPLTDLTIGAYSAATVFAVLGMVGVSEGNMATAWWLSLVLGLVVTVPTALTGLADWLTIPRGTELWRTATSHLAAMVGGTVFFLLAAVFGHGGYVDRDVPGGPFVLTLIGYALLAFGGRLGGSIVFVHGMRVRESPERDA